MKKYNEFKSSIKTPNNLLQWMNDNISYNNIDEDEWVLLSPNKLFKNKEGQCYDQSFFEYDVLNILDLKPNMFYFVYFDINNTNDGTTHSFCTFEYNESIFYFEHSWDDYKGIFGRFNEYESIKDLLKTNCKSYEPFKNYNSFYYSEIDINKLYDGMSFDDFQNIAQSDLIINNKLNYNNIEELNNDYRSNIS